MSSKGPPKTKTGKEKPIEIGFNLYDLPRPSSSPSKAKAGKARTRLADHLSNSTPPTTSAHAPPVSVKKKQTKAASSKGIPQNSTAGRDGGLLLEHLSYVQGVKEQTLPAEVFAALQTTLDACQGKPVAGSLPAAHTPVVGCLVDACRAETTEKALQLLLSGETSVKTARAVPTSLVLIQAAIVDLRCVLAPQSTLEAADLQRLDAAVAAGHPGAMLRVASLLRYGDAVPADTQAALTWLQRAAAVGYVPAMHELGELYEEGAAADACHVENDWGEAVQWYTLAAQTGYAPSQLNLGKLWLAASQEGLASQVISEEESKKMLADAKRWLAASASKGNDEATLLLQRIM